MDIISALTSDDIVVDRVTRKFGDFFALDSVSIQIRQGKLFQLVEGRLRNSHLADDILEPYARLHLTER